MKKSKRIISLILSLIIMLSITAGLDFSAYALSSSGYCGDNVKYNYDSNKGILEITGSGAMYNYSSDSRSPFHYTYITSVYIRSGVTSIGDAAFTNCNNLKYVQIPNSVTSIGDEAFYSCGSLKSATIPNGVISIGDWAFFGCGFESVIIPDSVTSIGNAAFACNSNLANITVNENNQYFDSRNNCNAIIQTSTNNLITGCVNTNIPNSVTKINDYAFYRCTGFTSVIIPDSVISIGNEAFSGCKSLKDVYYLDSEDDWKNIEIGSNNDYLKNATIHYHNHTYSIVDEDKKTCIILYRCDCGKEYKEFIDAYHTCDSFIGVVDGKLCYSCTACGKEYTQSASDVLEIWNSSIINASSEECRELDVVNDGIINAKDYAMLNHIKNYGY